MKVISNHVLSPLTNSACFISPRIFAVFLFKIYWFRIIFTLSGLVLMCHQTTRPFLSHSSSHRHFNFLLHFNRPYCSSLRHLSWSKRKLQVQSYSRPWEGRLNQGHCLFHLPTCRLFSFLCLATQLYRSAPIYQLFSFTSNCLTQSAEQTGLFFLNLSNFRGPSHNRHLLP